MQLRARDSHLAAHMALRLEPARVADPVCGGHADGGGGVGRAELRLDPALWIPKLDYTSHPDSYVGHGLRSDDRDGSPPELACCARFDPARANGSGLLPGWRAARLVHWMVGAGGDRLWSARGAECAFGRLCV